MVGEYERPLSLTTMTMGRSLAAAMLLRASHAMPPVIAPSPITVTTVRSDSPRNENALANPSAYDREAVACEDSTTSCSLSARHG